MSMRELVEKDCEFYLHHRLAEDKDGLEFTLDLDLGFWNADTDADLTEESCTQLIKKLTDDELFELLVYSYSTR
jgi:hypothetical protein